MTDKKSLAKSIFLDVVENRSSDQCSEFLDKACGDDSELRARVGRRRDNAGSSNVLFFAHDPIETPPLPQRPSASQKLVDATAKAYEDANAPREL